MANKFNLPEPITFERTPPKNPKQVIDTKPHVNTVDKNGNPQKPKGMIASQRVRAEGVLTSIYQDSLNEWDESTGLDRESFAKARVSEYIAETRCGKKKTWGKIAKAMGQEKK
jgi:O6-methylguanine-DNA--protein-cysteine methyltransferase